MGERSPDDIPRQIFHRRVIFWRYPVAEENIEAGMPPFVEHPHHLFRDLAFFQKHPENLVPENGLQLFEFQRRRDPEHPFVAVKTSVRQKYVAVRIEPEKIAEGLDVDDRARNRIFFGNRIPDKDLQGFSGAAAEAYKKFSIIQKMTAKNLGNTDTKCRWGIF